MPDESSLRVRGENNRDCIGELLFRVEPQSYASPEEALNMAKRRGYEAWDVRTINVVAGGPETNEPRAVIILRSGRIPLDGRFTDNIYYGDGLITRDPNDKKYYFASEYSIMP